MLRLKKNIFFVSALFVLFFLVFTVSLVQAANIVVNFTTTGNWTVPAGVTSLQVELWGGGGAGGGSTANNNAGSGGAGGQYVIETALGVSAGQSFNFSIAGNATGGTGNGPNGGNSTFFNTTQTYVRAVGGNGGGGNLGAAGNGSTTNSLGDITYAGGNGAKGVTNVGGGGGGGAGTTGVGNNASGVTAGAAKANNGGAGGNGATNVAGSPGNVYGGGGGGGEYGGSANKAGGNGAAGFIIINYTVVDSVYPLFSNYNITYITPANNTNYSSGAIYNFNATVTNTNGTVGLGFNGTNYTATNLTASVYNKTISNLAAGTYSYYWWAYGNGTDKNFNLTSLMSYTVAKATPNLTFKANGGTSNLSLIYPQQVNISAVNSSGTLSLEKDSVNYLSNNGLNVSLAAGSYIFRANITGNQNYSDIVYSYYNVTINKSVAQGSLTNTTAWTVTYPQQTNISYSESNTGDSDVKYNVSRDNVYKNGGENITLGFGTYNYILNTTGGTNYTANASMDAKILTVNKGVLQGSLTNTTALTITYPLAINVSYVETNTGDGDVTYKIYRDNVDVTATEKGLNISLSAGMAMCKLIL